MEMTAHIYFASKIAGFNQYVQIQLALGRKATPQQLIREWLAAYFYNMKLKREK